MSPKLNHRIVEVLRISDGIAILEALGEGKLMVSTRRRPKDKGWHNMAVCYLQELVGKSEADVLEMLDKKTDKVLELEKRRLAPR